MHQQPGQLYQSSGKIPVIGVLLGLITAPVIGVISAPIYAYATVYCPVVQLSVLLTLVYGLALGGLPALAMVRLGKVRNTAIVALVALASSGFGYLVSWPPWLFATMNRVGDVPLEVMLMPPAFVQMLVAVYEGGSWTIGSGGGSAVSGVMLGIVWLLEAAMVIGAGAFVGFAIGSGAGPFCERCEAWCKNVGALLHYGDEQVHTLVPRLLGGDLRALAEVPQVGPSTRPCLQVQAWRCPSCQDTATFHVQRVQMLQDRRGRTQERRDDLVKHLLVRGADVEWAQRGASGPLPR